VGIEPKFDGSLPSAENLVPRPCTNNSMHLLVAATWCLRYQGKDYYALSSRSIAAGR
jgi:hypothetical protein